MAAIALDPNNPKRVTATISLDPATPVRADTEVDITYQGLTGAAAVALKGGSPQAPRLTPQNGQLPRSLQVADVGRSLTESAQQTLRHIDGILDQNAKPLNTAITGIAAFAEVLGRNSQRVEGLLGGLENLTGTGTPKPGPAIYDLAPAAAFPQIDKPIKAQLIVPDPNAIISVRLAEDPGPQPRGHLHEYQQCTMGRQLAETGAGEDRAELRECAAAQCGEPAARATQRRIGSSLRSAVSRFCSSHHQKRSLTHGTARQRKGRDLRSAHVHGQRSGQKRRCAGRGAALNEAFAKVAGEIVVWTAGTI